MLSLKHILVATDLCPVSLLALRHALGIARRYHSTVSVLHVIDPSTYGLAGPDGISADADAALRQAEDIEASLRSEGCLEGIHHESILEVGPVWRTIADTVEEKCSALLVLGTHGRTGFRKFALGSVAESAFREAPCPVLSVGPRVLRAKSSGGEARHFLVPTDLSLESQSALPYGISLAEATGGDVTLLHVRDARLGSNDVDAAESVAAANTCLQGFLQLHPAAQAITPMIVQADRPADAIVAFTEERRMDLIVMGRRAWAPESQPMWRTAYAVVTRACCPVLSMQTPLPSTTPAV
ncbi:MAG TPA: universal stress protein [Terriglobales bacterium]|nr:universal stress protein [Terriglobales bacterium]